jgi:hypothetical protein
VIGMMGHGKESWLFYLFWLNGEALLCQSFGVGSRWRFGVEVVNLQEKLKKNGNLAYSNSD